jgi:hypothetical protein
MYKDILTKKGLTHSIIDGEDNQGGIIDSFQMGTFCESCMSPSNGYKNTLLLLVV